MQIEYEAKFYPIDKDNIRQKLTEVGATLTVPERLMRQVMADDIKYPQLPVDYIRIRDEVSCIRLSAKIHAAVTGKISDQKELDVIVSDFDKMTQIIQIMGYEPNFYQEKLRETWTYDNVEIVIDTWPGLNPYIEIEATSEKQIKEMAHKLGVDWDKRRITSVVEIFGEVYNLTNAQVLEKISHITFDSNPFA